MADNTNTIQPAIVKVYERPLYDDDTINPGSEVVWE